MGLNTDVREIAVEVARQVVKEELKQLELALAPCAAARGPEPMLTVDDVAKLCSVAPKTVVRWITKGVLRGTRMPGMREYRIARQHYDAFARGAPPEQSEADEELEAEATNAVARLSVKKTGGRR
jgi:excisionase family DNA binding protein